MPNDAILVLNAGSSSLKFSLFHAEGNTIRPGRDGQVEGIGNEPKLHVRAADGEPALDQTLPQDADALDAVGAWLRQHHPHLLAVGHRVVHGGTVFDGPALVDDAAVAAMESLVPLAPLHQPAAIAAIRAARSLFPGVMQVACFDTAFHHGAPSLWHEFGLPRRLTQAGVRRYGFHGLSYEYIAARLHQAAPEIAGGRVIVAHLGSGASLCAIAAGQSVATTMGMTPLDGLVMGTRCGALDPGAILYLLQHERMSPDAVQHLLYSQSGLLGVSGISGDMRKLLASADPQAARARDLFIDRIGREIGSLAAALGGLDGIVFTAGIGENDVDLRARVCQGAAWLGVDLDHAANGAGGPRLTRPGSHVSAWCIPTDENRVIAQHVLRMTRQGP